MPLPSWSPVFTIARHVAGDPEIRYVVVVRPNQNLLCLAAPLPGSMPPEKTAQMESIVSSSTRRNICAIAPTDFTPDATETAKPGVADLLAAGKAIPFFGLLTGFAYIGHTVWVFDGQPAAIAPGCKDADVLFIDSALATKLTTKTVADAAAVMRNANILVHDRSTYQLRVLRKVGSSNDRIEFA